MSKYEELLAQQSASIESDFEEEIEIEEQSNRRLDSLISQCESVTGKPVIEDWYFKTGKLQGLLRHIIQNPKKRSELLGITGLTETLLRKFDAVSGRLPYQDKKTGMLVEGTKPNIPQLRKLLIYIATKLGILLLDNQLDDLNENNWNKIYSRRQESVEKTLEADRKFNDNAVTYDE